MTMMTVFFILTSLTTDNVKTEYRGYYKLMTLYYLNIYTVTVFSARKKKKDDVSSDLNALSYSTSFIYLISNVHTEENFPA